MTYDEIKKSVEEITNLLYESERLTITTIKFVEGNLRKLSQKRYNGISSHTLSCLKKELQKWDMNKKKWK